MIYDSWSVPRIAILSPREISPESTSLHPHILPLSLRVGFSPRVREGIAICTGIVLTDSCSKASVPAVWDRNGGGEGGFLYKRSVGTQSDLIAASIYDEYSTGPSIRPICTRCCLTMTNVIQVCSNFHSARVFIANTRPDEITWRSERTRPSSGRRIRTEAPTPSPPQRALFPHHHVYGNWSRSFKYSWDLYREAIRSNPW